MKSRIDSVQSAGVLPKQQDLLDALGRLLSKPVQAGDPATPVIAAILQSLEAASDKSQSPQDFPNSGPTMPIPGVLAKILSPLPHRFKWVATILAPLLMGGGAAVPLWQNFVGGARVLQDHLRKEIQAKDLALKDVDEANKKNQQTKKDDERINEDLRNARVELETTKADMNKKGFALDQHVSQINVLKEKNQNLENEAKRTKEELKNAKSHVTQVDASNVDLIRSKGALAIENNNQVKALRDQISRLKNSPNAPQPSPKTGFVEWHGRGKVIFPNSDPASVVGNFPSGKCTVVEVVGQHVDPKKNGRGLDCHQSFSFEVKKNSETTAYILWTAP